MSTERKSTVLSILAVDDSAVYRKILKDVVEKIDGVEFLGTAQNGRAALDKIRSLAPDVVLLASQLEASGRLGTLTDAPNLLVRLDRTVQELIAVLSRQIDPANPQ